MQKVSMQRACHELAADVLLLYSPAREVQEHNLAGVLAASGVLAGQSGPTPPA